METCVVCVGGWNLYWTTILNGQHARLCGAHVAEGRGDATPDVDAALWTATANTGMPSPLDAKEGGR